MDGAVPTALVLRQSGSTRIQDPRFLLFKKRYMPMLATRCTSNRLTRGADFPIIGKSSHEISKDWKAMNKLKVLFLCTGNSCRSQMAEGWAKALKSDVIEAWSAGIEKHGMNPNAIKVMAEAGVDITRQHSKRVDELADVAFDVVITVCGHADETCPAWLSGKARVVHAGFDDPPKLAKTARSEEEALGHYRRVRDEIRTFVAGLPGNIG